MKHAIFATLIFVTSLIFVIFISCETVFAVVK